MSAVAVEQGPKQNHADQYLHERTSTKAMRWGIGGSVVGLGLKALGVAMGWAGMVAAGAIIWPVSAVVAVGGAVASLFGRKKH